MNRIFVLFISISLIANVFVACVHARGNEPFTTYTFSDIAISSVNLVEVTTLNSSLTLTGSAESQAVVELYVSVNGNGSIFRRRNWSNEEIKRYLEENYTIEVKVDSEKLLAVAKPKTNGSQSLSISFKITVPSQMNSNLRTTNGRIQISNLSGSQNLQAVNGSLKVDNVSGKISGRTTNGSINVLDSNDEIDLRSTNGSITANNCNGIIELRTTNGRITETDCDGKIKLSTKNGRVVRR